MAQTSDSQSAIDVLRGESERLVKELAKATSASDKYKADHDTLSATHAELKKQSGDIEAHKKRADEALQELRTLRHKQAFAQVAKAAGAKEDALDDLFTLSGYKAEKDDVDAKAFDGLVEELKVKKSYAFAEEKQAAEGTGKVIDAAANGTQLKPVPAAGRGTTHAPSKSGITLTKDLLQDPKFMLDKTNQTAIIEAAKARRFK
jgi:seryl-tRNA synthetase